jgi:hypothetical protein
VPATGFHPLPMNRWLLKLLLAGAAGFLMVALL